jgi:hypothetical protein
MILFTLTSSRFESESSVPHALAFGGGLVPEKDVRITIRPVHRSKWMKPHHSQQQPRKLPPLPITHQQPSQDDFFSPSKNHAHIQVHSGCSLASSRTSASEPDQHEIPSRPTSTSTLPQAFSSNPRVEQQTISPINESKRDEKFVKFPAPIDMSVANRKHFACEASRDHVVDPTSSPRQAMDYPMMEKCEKEGVLFSESLSQRTVVEKSVGCDLTTAECDSSKCYPPEILDIALPSTPINSICSSSDTPKAAFSNNGLPATELDSPMSKCNNREIKSPSPTVLEDSQHRTSSVVGGIENAARKFKEGEDETATSSDLRKAQNPIKDIERPPITTLATSEKHIESNTNGGAQVSSYTEREIKERKQAWNRIPMPLDPRKSKKLGTAVASSQQASPPILKELSSNAAEKPEIVVSHIRNCDQLKSIDTLQSDKIKPRQLTKTEESAKNESQDFAEDKSLDYELRSAQQPTVSPNSRVSTNVTTNGETQSSNIETRGPHQTALEDRDATASHSQAPAGENKTSDTANSQIKSKQKWNKAKKSKKRSVLVSSTVLQNEGGSQDISSSVSETPFIPEEELRTDDKLMPVPEISRSSSRPVQFTGKLDERAIEHFKEPVEQATTNARSQYSYDTLPRGRHEFRSNAGGSLKVSKKRKNKYPAITSKTVEASSTSRLGPPQLKHTVSGQMPMRSTDDSYKPDSVTHISEPDSSTRSRLNPLATAFESPQKVGITVIDTVKAPSLYNAGSLRKRGEEELPRENRSPSKFKIMQRATIAHNSPSKYQQSKEKLVRRIDSSKAGDGFGIPSKQQENNPAEIQRSWSKDKHQKENESKEPVISKATSPSKKAALDKEDWPSLPASRARSATLQ